VDRAGKQTADARTTGRDSDRASVVDVADHRGVAASRKSQLCGPKRDGALRSRTECAVSVSFAGL
jgi:hypothetical protein